jgi:molybdopterin-guanine dinucleotide biosynthesis protein A
MGQDKALIRIDGRTLLERQVALAWSLGAAEVWVSGRAQGALGSLRARGLPDAAPGQGPLGGLATVLAVAGAPHVLVLAVDMPALTEAFLARLLSRRAPGVGAVPRTRAGWEPAAAVYPRELAPAAAAALAAGRRALHMLVEDGVTARRLIAIDASAGEEAQLASWNAPEDVRTDPREPQA